MFDKRHLLILLMCLSSAARAQFGDSFPVLKFDQDTVDFGVVNEGDTVQYDFWFTNTGTRDLVIRQAYPACGCTIPTYTQGVIKPGERGKIHVEFHSKGWGGQTVVKEVIIILVNGPENYARFKAKIVNKAFQNDLDQYKQNSAAGSSDKPKKKLSKAERKYNRERKKEKKHLNF